MYRIRRIYSNINPIILILFKEVKYKVATIAIKLEDSLIIPIISLTSSIVVKNLKLLKPKLIISLALF